MGRGVWLQGNVEHTTNLERNGWDLMLGSVYVNTGTSGSSSNLVILIQGRR